MMPGEKLVRSLLVTVVVPFAFATELKAAVVVSANKDQIRTFTGTDNVKMVWSNQKYLYFIDFSETTPAVRKMTNTSGAVAPTISPDGNYVTYATGALSDGSTSAKSSAWLARLEANATPVLVCQDSGYNPRFIQNAQVPTVLYSTCGSQAPPDSFAWRNCGRTVKREFRNNALGSEQLVHAGGSYFGGLSYDNRYLCTAEQKRNCWMLDLQDAANGPHYLFWLSYKNKTTGVDTLLNPQVCNSSISASKIFPDVMMHLSFSFNLSNYESPKYPNRWGMHDRFVLSNYAGEVVKYCMQPTDLPLIPIAQVIGVGEPDITEVDDPEWSNHPYFASANLLVQRQYKKNADWVQKKRHERLYIYNIKDTGDKYIRVVESNDTSLASLDDLQWPWAWVEIPSNFQEDSDWLKPGVAVAKPFRQAHINGPAIQFNGSTVISSVPIRKISVFSLIGELLTTIVPANQSTRMITIPDFAARGPAGVLFMAVETEASRQVFKLTTAH